MSLKSQPMFLSGVCALCHQPGFSPCRACQALLRSAPTDEKPPELDFLHGVVAYEGAGRELVTAFKFRNRRSSVSWFASRLAQVVPTDPTFDCLTWVPASKKGRTERGFDPGKILARALGAELGVPAYRLFVRTGKERQSERSAIQRELGPSLELTRRALGLRRILLVDDVSTTGASLAAAARLLRSAGVGYVGAAVAARTPVQRCGPRGNASEHGLVELQGHHSSAAG